MVHAAKPKKQKGDSAFTKKKQKVGKKKLAPVTATKAEVHAAGLRIVRPEQESLAEGKSVLDVVQSERRKPIRALRECIAETTHYRDVARAGAFAGIHRYLTLTLPKQKERQQRKQNLRNGRQQQEHDETEAQVDAEGNSLEVPSPLQLLSLLQLCIDRQTDGHQEARKHSLSVLQILFEENLPLDLVALISFVQLPLTHAERSIKSTGLELLALLLQHYPAFATVASLESKQSSSKNAGAENGIHDAFDGDENPLETLVSATAHAVLSMPTGSPAQRAGYATLNQLVTRLYPPGFIGFTADGRVCQTTKTPSHAAPLRPSFFQGTVTKIFFTRLCTLWGELSDIQAGGKHVLRDAEQGSFGVTILNLIATMGAELIRQGALNKHYAQALKSILSRFPFSVEELTQTHTAGGKRRKEGACAQRWRLALAMCSALQPLYGTSPDTTRFIDSVVKAASACSIAKQEPNGEEQDQDELESGVSTSGAEEEEENASDDDEEDAVPEPKRVTATVAGLPPGVEPHLFQFLHRLLVSHPRYVPHVLTLVLPSFSERVEHWVLAVGDQPTAAFDEEEVLTLSLIQLWVDIVRVGFAELAVITNPSDYILVPATVASGIELEENKDALPKPFQTLEPSAAGDHGPGERPTYGQFLGGVAASISVLPKCLFLLTRIQLSDASPTVHRSALQISNDFARLLWTTYAHHIYLLAAEDVLDSVPTMLQKLLAPQPQEETTDANDVTAAHRQATCMVSSLGESTVEILAAASRFSSWRTGQSSERGSGDASVFGAAFLK